MTDYRTAPATVCPHKLEYNAAKLRIDQALETLKKELKSMRDQDVALLKHLIKINESIRKLARVRSNSKTNQRKVHFAGGGEPIEHGRARLVRQLSEPHDCRMVQKENVPLGSSIGSLEDYVGDYGDELSMSSGSELDDSTPSLRDIRLQTRPIARPRSISFLSPAAKKDTDSPTTNNAMYEEILRRNIFLWKNRLSPGAGKENDSVFCEEDEELDGYNNITVV